RPLRLTSASKTRGRAEAGPYTIPVYFSKFITNAYDSKEPVHMQIQNTHTDQQNVEHSPLASEQDALLEAHRAFRIGLAYGHFVHRFRWFVLAFWIVALVASVPFAAQVSTLLSGGGFSFGASESAQVADQ